MVCGMLSAEAVSVEFRSLNQGICGMLMQKLCRSFIDSMHVLTHSSAAARRMPHTVTASTVHKLILNTYLEYMKV